MNFKVYQKGESKMSKKEKVSAVEKLARIKLGCIDAVLIWFGIIVLLIIIGTIISKFI